MLIRRVVVIVRVENLDTKEYQFSLLDRKVTRKIFGPIKDWESGEEKITNSCEKCITKRTR